MHIDFEVCGRIYCKETSFKFQTGLPNSALINTNRFQTETGLTVHFVQTKNQSQKLSKPHQRINSILKVF